MVVKHQQHAGKGEHEEKIKGNPAHAPGVAIAHCIPIDFGGMKVEKYIGKHAQRSIAGGVVVFVAEDGGVYLGLRRIFCDLYLFFGFGGHVGFQRLDVFLYPRHHLTADAV